MLDINTSFQLKSCTDLKTGFCVLGRKHFMASIQGNTVYRYKSICMGESKTKDVLYSTSCLIVSQHTLLYCNFCRHPWQYFN